MNGFTYTQFTLHFKTMPGQRNVLATIGCEHFTLLLHNHTSTTVTVNFKQVYHIHTQLLQFCVAMVGRQLLLSFAEACGQEHL